MRDPATRRIVLLSLALLAVRALSLAVVAQPGYTDAYYYASVAERLARGEGLSADFVWSFLEAPGLAALPVPSHRFWMPLASALGAAGIATLGSLLGTFRAAQLPIVLVAALLPWLSWRAARGQGASERAALVAAALVGLGGLFAPAWVALDGFAPAALAGTAFFLAYGRAATGSARAGLACGLACGILFLARAEGALFGAALLALALRPVSRRAGLTGSAVALAIGSAWLARDAAVGGAGDALARSALLVRYEDFFALRAVDAAALLASPGDALGARLGALGADAVTLAAALSFVLVPPLVVGLWTARSRPDVRAFAGLGLLVYLAEALVWTLHATRGSYFHSLAAFFPFAVALAVVGAERWLAPRGARTLRVAAGGALAAVAILSVAAVLQWDTAFNAPYRVRAAALDALPAGPLLAIDAAAWRWIARRPALVTPADGLAAAGCVARAYAAGSLVLEAAHFRAYGALYRGDERPAWLGAAIERGPVRVFPVVAPPPCVP